MTTHTFRCDRAGCAARHIVDAPADRDTAIARVRLAGWHAAFEGPGHGWVFLCSVHAATTAFDAAGETADKAADSPLILVAPQLS